MLKITYFGTTVLLGIIRSQKSRYKAWSKAEKKMIKYDWDECDNIKCITSQFHELMTAFPKEWFGERKGQFEDIMVSIPSNAEAYCKAMYGDYMALPPKEKQVVRHHTGEDDDERDDELHRGGEESLSAGPERTFPAGRKKFHVFESAAGRPGLEDESGDVGAFEQMHFGPDPVHEFIGLVLAGGGDFADEETDVNGQTIDHKLSGGGTVGCDGEGC